MYSNEYKVCTYITEIVRQGMYSTEWSGYIVHPPCQESAHLRVVIFGRGTVTSVPRDQIVLTTKHRLFTPEGMHGNK